MDRVDIKCDWRITVLTWLLWTLVALDDVRGFNVAVDRATVLHGDPDSYFGFSLALHENGRGDTRLLVGAPRANSSHQPGLLEPGAVLSCPTDPGQQGALCTQLKLDDQGNQEIRTTFTKYKEVKDGQWLGVSVASQTQNELGPAVVACGHRWSDVRYRNHRFPNGVCYTLNADLEFASVAKRLPMVKSGLQVAPGGMYYYAMGQLGLSTHFTKGGSELLVGAVGLKDWRGGVVRYSGGGDGAGGSGGGGGGGGGGRGDGERVVRAPDAVPFNSYAGYSVSSGTFFHDGATYTVVGAPRANNVGKVYLYTGDFEIITEFTGTQMGAYFGAALCVLDVNSDGLDDVLVGAPQLRGATYDEGGVYVYVNQNLGSFVRQVAPLVGSSSPGARFGTSIGAVGDINNDGFPDVAIGAPYEDGGRGAVYLHLGTRLGLSPRHAQRVRARAVSEHLRGFGHALSGPVDLDSNGYPDLAVGAYASDRAVLLFSRPVVSLSTSINFYPSTIEPRRATCHHQGELRSCVALTASFLYTGRSVPRTLDVLYSVEVDGERTGRGLPPRGEVRAAGGGLTARVGGSAALRRGERRDLELIIIIKEDVADVLSPLWVRLDYSLPESAGAGAGAGSGVVLDATRPPSLSKAVPFAKNCGKDDLCHSDLALSAEFLPSADAQPFVVVGYVGKVTVRVTLRNRGEAAYATEVGVATPEVLSFVGVRTIAERAESRVRCSLENIAQDSGNNTLLCEAGNPLPGNSSVTFDLLFELPRAPPGLREVVLQLDCSTQSVEEEAVQGDNGQKLRIPVKVQSQLDVTLLSRPEQFLLNKTRLQNSTSWRRQQQQQQQQQLGYLVDVYNGGPGFVPLATLEVRVPWLTDQTSPVLRVTSVEAFAGAGSRTAGIQCSRKLVHDRWVEPPAAGVEPPEVAGEPTSGAPLSTLVPGDTHSAHRDTARVTWNCSTSVCVTYVCDVSAVSSGDSVVFSLDAQLNLSTLALYQNATEFVITASVRVQREDDVSASYHVSTTLTFGSSAPARRDFPPLHIWQLSLAVLTGFFLLGLVILVLIKCGFFERKQQMELRRLIRENAQNEARARMLGGGDGEDEALVRMLREELNSDAMLPGNPEVNHNLVPGSVQAPVGATSWDFYLEDDVPGHDVPGYVLRDNHVNGFLPTFGLRHHNGLYPALQTH